MIDVLATRPVRFDGVFSRIDSPEDQLSVLGVGALSNLSESIAFQNTLRGDIFHRRAGEDCIDRRGTLGYRNYCRHCSSRVASPLSGWCNVVTDLHIALGRGRVMISAQSNDLTARNHHPGCIVVLLAKARGDRTYVFENRSVIDAARRQAQTAMNGLGILEHPYKIGIHRCYDLGFRGLNRYPRVHLKLLTRIANLSCTEFAA